MPTKRKSGKKKTGKKRMGATAKINAYNPIIQLAAVGAGLLVADPLNAGIDKLTNGKVDGKLVAAGQAGVGAAFLLVKFSKKRTWMDLIPVAGGGVLAGAGLKRGWDEYQAYKAAHPAVAGYQNVPVIGRRGMNGYQNVPVIGKRMNGYSSTTVPVGGFNVPPPIHKQVMGSTGNGSGLMRDNASGYMG